MRHLLRRRLRIVPRNVPNLYVAAVQGKPRLGPQKLVGKDAGAPWRQRLVTADSQIYPLLCLYPANPVILSNSSVPSHPPSGLASDPASIPFVASCLRVPKPCVPKSFGKYVSPFEVPCPMVRRLERRLNERRIPSVVDCIALLRGRPACRGWGRFFAGD